MKNVKRIAIFLAMMLVLCSLFSLTAIAATPENGNAEDVGKLDMGLKPDDFGERLEYAVQGTVTGILMVFAVLTLLCLILYGSKCVFYDIPNRKREKKNSAAKRSSGTSAQPVVPEISPEVAAQPVPAAAQDDGELAAVITAAIAAMIESGDYKNEFVGGFRVVSFKRSNGGAWNRK